MKTRCAIQPLLKNALRVPLRSLRPLRFKKNPGMTLIELLAVLMIVAMMMAMSAAVYWQMSQNMKQQGAAGDVDVALRQARNNAMSSNSPAFVEIDSANHALTPWVYKTVGQWHFESKDTFGRTPGAHATAVIRGAAELWKDGKIGKCIYLKPGGCIDAGNNPDFDLEDGGYLEAYIRPKSITEGGNGYIFFKEHAYFLNITTKMTLEGSAGGSTLRAPDYRLASGRWTKVAFAWDPHSTRILVDDAIVAIGKGSVPEVSEHPLLFGLDDGGFVGFIDEVRVMTCARGRTVNLPSASKIDHTAQPWDAIYFSADGTLDIHHHPGPVSITLTQGTTVRTVTVSMLGLTQREEVESTVKQ